MLIALSNETSVRRSDSFLEVGSNTLFTLAGLLILSKTQP
jgi:hypothetical protein